MDGEPGGEVFRQAVVWEEDEEDHDDEINNNPTAPYNNKQGLLPVNAYNPIIFLGKVIIRRDNTLQYYWILIFRSTGSPFVQNTDIQK